MTAVPGAAGHFPVRAHLAVLAAGILFGSTFLPMQHAVDDAQPVPFLAARFLFGALALWPLARRERAALGDTRAGLLCGVALGLGYILQTVGLQYTTTSVSAFLTYLLVVIVPLLSAAVLRRVPARMTMVGVVLATAGLFLLTGGGDVEGFGRGEALTIGCAVAFAVHILLLDRFARGQSLFRLSTVQLLVVGAGLFLPGLALGGYGFGLKTWLAAAYTGVAVSAGALVLQFWGQRQVGPTRASLLLTVEPVTAAFVGYAIGERLGWTGAAGAVLILGGIAVAEIGGLLTERSSAYHAPRDAPHVGVVRDGPTD